MTERRESFKTSSNIPVNRVYGPQDLEQAEPPGGLGFPGEFPYLRGIHPTGYRGKLWTMRMFAGFGMAEETNQRFKYLLDGGQTGLSVAFDMPTLYGYDTDDPAAAGEFGKCGVAVSSLADMEVLFDGIPLDKITTSMTINAPGGNHLGHVHRGCGEAGRRPSKPSAALSKTTSSRSIQRRTNTSFRLKPSMRLVTDTIEFATEHLPRWNPISISGYHIREAGSTAVQEMAFTLADGFEYVNWCLERGLKIDDFAPRLSFFFNVHNNFFEEIAKFRAARRVWAREMAETYGAENPRSRWMRFHAQTAGCSLTAQQPENNIIRVAVQALAAVLGGCQSLHTNSMDEAWALPSEQAVLLALRTQQIIAEESGVVDTVDPLGGSYYLETLTRQVEEAAYDYFRRIEDVGGVIPAIESGYLQREIADASYDQQRAFDSGEEVVVGMNAYTDDGDVGIPLLKVDMEGERRQLKRLDEVRRSRDDRQVASTLRRLDVAAGRSENLMPPIIEAVRAYATLGEIMGVLRNRFGEYVPTWGI